jgi:predicted aconitase
MLFAAAFASASLEAAHAGAPRPLSAISIHLGDVSGVAYYTVGRDGFHLVTTLAQGVAGTPVRVVSVLAPGQSLAFSTPRQQGALEISRTGDSVLVREVK